MGNFREWISVKRTVGEYGGVGDDMDKEKKEKEI